MLVLKNSSNKTVVLEAGEMAWPVRACAAQTCKGQVWYCGFEWAPGCSDVALKRFLCITMQAHNRHFIPILRASPVTLNPQPPPSGMGFGSRLFSTQPNLSLLLLGLGSLQGTCVGAFRDNCRGGPGLWVGKWRIRTLLHCWWKSKRVRCLRKTVWQLLQR